MRKRLWRQLEQQQDEFLSVASHELKTPLTTLKLLAQMSLRRLRDGDSPRERDHAAHMEAAIIRMERLINDLLDVSRIQSGRLALRLERCDLTRLCRETVATEATASGRDIVLRAPTRPVYVQADAERIAQVVIYLLTNALKYSQSTSPAPTVRLRRAGGEASVVVQDDGSGIAPEALPHIFERFYRAPGAQTQSGSSVGLGLGLYITREIIERHGGRIWVESALGKGSRFCFTLPLSAPLRPRG
jgi:signal transduction histidine kinase